MQHWTSLYTLLLEIFEVYLREITNSELTGLVSAPFKFDNILSNCSPNCWIISQSNLKRLRVPRTVLKDLCKKIVISWSILTYDMACNYWAMCLSYFHPIQANTWVTVLHRQLLTYVSTLLQSQLLRRLCLLSSLIQFPFNYMLL